MMAVTYSDYHQLENVVKKHMSDALSSGAATVEQIQELAYILSKTETPEELSALIRILVDRYPFLEHLVFEERGQTKQDLEAIVKPFVLQIIVTNPTLAAQISADASKPDATLEALTASYPEFGEYVRKQK